MEAMTVAEIDIEALSRDEKLSLLDRLWESLSRVPDALPLTEAQRRELDRRLDELDAGDTSGIPWEQVLEQIRQRAN